MQTASQNKSPLLALTVMTSSQIASSYARNLRSNGRPFEAMRFAQDFNSKVLAQPSADQVKAVQQLIAVYDQGLGL